MPEKVVRTVTETKNLKGSGPRLRRILRRFESASYCLVKLSGPVLVTVPNSPVKSCLLFPSMNSRSLCHGK